MKKIILLTFIFFLLLLALQGTKSGIALSETTPDTTFTLGEGIDFATRVLGDPWDMSNFTDISQWLNHVAPSDYLVDIQVSNGLFSARTLGNYSNFYPLFPGYEPGINSGKIGARFPIDSSTYACLYIAMYANTPETNYLSVFWAPDRNLGGNVWGMASGYWFLKNDPWRLYSIDLNHPATLTNNPWSYRQTWQALRITPSLKPDTQFYVDWVRLTNCQPVYANLSGLSQGTYTMWLGTGSPERQILVINSFSPKPDGSYAWDVQGLPAGSYKYYVKASGNTVQQGQLNIIGSPIVTFTSPSPYSGPDYANAQGNPWDMDPSDVTRIDCASYSFTNGILSLDTPTRACAGPGANEADPHIYLNTVDHGNLSSYRYLSFPSRTDGAWSVPDLGMIVRLIWRLDRPGEDCYYVSRAIALDIGWQTYTVDLYDPLNGIPEEKTPADCPLVSWRDQAAVGPVVGFRLDPNENITGGNMHQEFDWIRLTKVEQVSQGKPVKIRVLLNKQPSEVTLHFYYTTDLSQQTQNLASTYPTTIFAAPNIQYLPIVFAVDPNYDPFVDHIPADVTYLWNTRGVAPGEYYSCAQASDGYNQATYCSQVPVQINP
jgi:hypothetical protein